MVHPDLLILAVTQMRSGVCVAGMSAAAHPVTQLCWIRPVKLHGPLLPGDIRYADGRLIRAGDVVSWRMGVVRPDPPHVEDVLVNPIRDCPQFLRRLSADQRAQFCAAHLDRAPADVLCHATRSLCIVKPDSARATWTLDRYSGHYEARIAFQSYDCSSGERGFPVTDLAWRALGRSWLGAQERLSLDDAELCTRLDQVYLVLGLGRLYNGRHWPLVVGVHAAAMPEVDVVEMI
jgi:hypothetical protein